MERHDMFEDEEALAYNERVKIRLLSQAWIDSCEVKQHSLRSILKKLPNENLNSMLESLEEPAHSKDHSGRSGKSKEKDIQAGLQVDEKIAALIARITETDYIADILPFFVPALVKLFVNACGKRYGVPLDDEFLLSIDSELHTETHITEIILLQLFGLGFIAAKKPNMDQMALTTPSGESFQEFDFKKIDLRFIVPYEVKKAYRTYSAETKAEIEQLSELYCANNAIARAAANLYGAISLEDFAKVLHRILKGEPTDDHYTENDAKEDAHLFSRSLFIHCPVQNDYFLDSYKGKEYIIHTSYKLEAEEEDEDAAGAAEAEDSEPEADKELLSYLLSQQHGKNWYIPSFKELCNYTVPEYFEQTEYVKTLRRMLKPVCKGYSEDGERFTAREQREGILCDIHQAIQFSYDIEDILDVITQQHLKIEKLTDSLQKTNAQASQTAGAKTTKTDHSIGYAMLISAITDMSNNTRLWSNRGWTPMELINMTGRNGQSLKPREILFGPNMTEALRSGEMNIEEMRQGILNMNGTLSASVKESMLKQLDSIDHEKSGEPVKIKKKPCRNDPCPCGSGKKYKNCCGKKT